MIACVSLNPAVDKYIRLRQLLHGEHVEAQEVVTSAGGKAVNVAGVLRELGEEVECIAFLGGFTGAWIREQIEREGIRCHAVQIAADTRTAFVMVEENGTETELVEPGGAVTPEEIAALRSEVRSVAGRAAVMVLSGSVPPGCPPDIYPLLLEDCADRCPVIVDTSRVFLQAVLQDRSHPRPRIIKPNRREAEAALGTPLPTPQEIGQALGRFAETGIAVPVISDGARGLYAWRDGQICHAQPPAVQRVNSVGSGDAAVAGMAAALARGGNMEAMLRLAAACGAANVLTKECARVHRADIERLLPATRIEVGAQRFAQPQ